MAAFAVIIEDGSDDCQLKRGPRQGVSVVALQTIWIDKKMRDSLLSGREVVRRLVSSILHLGCFDPVRSLRLTRQRQRVLALLCVPYVFLSGQRDGCSHCRGRRTDSV